MNRIIILILSFYVITLHAENSKLPITYTDYSWQSTRTPDLNMDLKSIGTKENRICFLTGIKGRFDNINYGQVGLYIFPDDNTYFLGAKNPFTKGLSATASCAENINRNYPQRELSTEIFSWSEHNNDFVRMLDKDVSMCYLSKIGGKFMKINKEKPTVYIYGHSPYTLSGIDTQKRAIAAEANCIHPLDGTTATEIVRSSSKNPPVELANADEYACFLSELLGTFQHPDTEIKLYRERKGQKEVWMLDIKAFGTDQLNAGATCVYDI